MKYRPKLSLERFEASFKAIDSHTVGEFTRVIISGFSELKGNSMMERKKYAQKHFDSYRRALMLEPRGHHHMFGALLTKPISPEADLGVIFMDTGKFVNMCGHGTIGIATVAVETGLVKAIEPYTEVVIETPAGIIHTNARVEKGKAVEITLTNVPAFLYKENLEVKVEDMWIPYDISFGGSFFALIDTKRIGADINAKSVSRLSELGVKILEKINKEVQVQHPYLDITSVDNCEFYGPPESIDATMRNVVTNREAMIDRSPCGTGTSAKLATLFARGEIAIGEPFIYESFMGTKFRGVVKEETSIGSYKAIIPQITGSAYITGEATYVIDSADPLKYGFIID
jgi:proline racemase